MEKTVLAIDPGTVRCGMALVRRESDGKLKLLWRQIIPADAVVTHLQEAYDVHPYSLLIIGAGTNVAVVVRQIRSQLPAISMLEVDERDTTIQARERYWEQHPRRGWRRFVPATLTVPPEPIDDYAALVIAERVLATH
jgi:RNase H-fold protein (predicted Holliday junction resolvase)